MKTFREELIEVRDKIDELIKQLGTETEVTSIPEEPLENKGLRERSVQVYPKRQSVQGRVGGEERSVGFGQLAFVVRTDAVFFFHFVYV